MPKFTFEDHQKKMRDILQKKQAAIPNNGHRPLRVPKFIQRKRGI